MRLCPADLPYPNAFGIAFEGAEVNVLCALHDCNASVHSRGTGSRKPAYVHLRNHGCDASDRGFELFGVPGKTQAHEMLSTGTECRPRR